MRFRGNGSRFVTPQPLSGWTFVPVWIDNNEVATLHLIDAASGDMQQITGEACGYWGFSSDGSSFIYGICTGDARTFDGRAEFRTLDLETGTDELFAVVTGLRTVSLTRRVHLSPSGEWLLVYAVRGGVGYATVGVSRSGETRDLASEMWPLGWVDDSSLLVGLSERWRVINGEAARSYQQLNLINLDSRSNRIIYP